MQPMRAWTLASHRALWNIRWSVTASEGFAWHLTHASFLAVGDAWHQLASNRAMRIGDVYRMMGSAYLPLGRSAHLPRSPPPRFPAPEGVIFV
jgi:hypothetical protein